MSRLVRALPDLTRVAFADVVTYRAEMAIWILATTLPLVMLAVWDAVVAEGPVAGFDGGTVARYFFATLVVRQLTGVWLLWELSHEIRSGTLSIKLLRPQNPLVYSALQMLLALPLRLLVLAPILIAFAALRPELLWSASPSQWALFLLTSALAWWITFGVQALIGMVSFWADKADGLFGVWFTFWMLASGYTIPFAFMPDVVRDILFWLPFRASLALPVEVWTGTLPVLAAGPDLAVALMWGAGLAFAAAAMWRRGLARYGAFGA